MKNIEGNFIKEVIDNESKFISIDQQLEEMYFLLERKYSRNIISEIIRKYGTYLKMKHLAGHSVEIGRQFAKIEQGWRRGRRTNKVIFNNKYIKDMDRDLPTILIK